MGLCLLSANKTPPKELYSQTDLQSTQEEPCNPQRTQAILRDTLLCEIDMHSSSPSPLCVILFSSFLREAEDCHTALERARRI